jgi:hypothetical protein
MKNDKVSKAEQRMKRKIMSDNETKTPAGSENRATPMTDEHCGITTEDDPQNFYCTVEFTRSLERQLAEAKKDADALRVELTTAKADTERLDWMINQRFRVNPQIIDGDGPFWDVLKSRQAIDKAREGEE